MQVMDDILTFLKSGQWYTVKDVVEGCSLPECKIGTVLKFLDEYDFLQMNPKEQKVRIHPNSKKFFNLTNEE